MLGVLSIVGCAHSGPYVWVDSYEPPPQAQQAATLISQGDVLQVRVFNQDQLSTRTRVRGDGRITVPLLNDVEAAGRSPSALARDLEARLTPMIKNPVVTVSVEESKAKSVFVGGEVVRPGAMPLDADLSVLQALVGAGGLSPDADEDRIFVLRTTPKPVRIRFSYNSLLDPRSRASAFKLQQGDVVVVE